MARTKSRTFDEALVRLIEIKPGPFNCVYFHYKCTVDGIDFGFQYVLYWADKSTGKVGIKYKNSGRYRHADWKIIYCGDVSDPEFHGAAKREILEWSEARASEEIIRRNAKRQQWVNHTTSLLEHVLAGAEFESGISASRTHAEAVVITKRGERYTINYPALLLTGKRDNSQIHTQSEDGIWFWNFNHINIMRLKLGLKPTTRGTKSWPTLST